MKPKEEWIISADAQPAIIDRDTFNAVTIKGKERYHTGSAFKQTGPSLYLLRGILKCPDCGINMVTGSSKKGSRGKSRYYHCGTYHRKGSKSCNRNGVYKELIDNAVVNTLIREFTLLNYTGSLEDEIHKHYNNQNRELLFQLARVDDEINHLQKRIDSVSKNNLNDDPGRNLSSYIKEMKSEISNLQKQKNDLTAQKIKPDINRDDIKYLLDKLKNFITRIKTEPPDLQHIILKEFLVSITANKVSGGYKLIYKLELPSELNKYSQTILEKTLYFSLDLQ